MQAVRATGIVALSAAVYKELAEVLSRPKFLTRINGRRRSEILRLLNTDAMSLDPNERVLD